jgi:hypothetical protein
MSTHEETRNKATFRRFQDATNDHAQACPVRCSPLVRSSPARQSDAIRFTRTAPENRGASAMPWSTEDVDRHKKGLSTDKKELWVKVANEVLDKTGDEGRAIREANAAVDRVEER